MTGGARPTRPPPALGGSAAHDGDRLADLGYDAQLRRSLSLGDLLVYGLVSMVPIAPFAIFGIVFNASKGMVPLTYVIGLVAMVFTALSYREMSRAFPVAGLGVRLRRARPPPVGRFPRRVGDPARLPAGPHPLLCRRRGRDAFSAAARAASPRG